MGGLLLGCQSDIPWRTPDATPVATPVLNYDAATDQDGDEFWQNETEFVGLDWDLSTPTISRTTNPTTNYPGITAAYVFDTSAGGAMEDLKGLPGNEQLNDASFELWFRPATLAPNQIMFETGGTGTGEGVALSLAGSTLEFMVYDSGGVFTLAAPGIGAAEVTHVYAVIDITGSSLGGEDTDLLLYVDGVLADSLSDVNVSDWTNGDNSGLGTVAGTTYTSNTANFQGEIAVLRFYQTVLSAADVRRNFESLAGSN